VERGKKPPCGEASSRGLAIRTAPTAAYQKDGIRGMKKKPRDPLLVRRQRYRLRATIRIANFPVCPEWVDHEGVYEGDIDPSSQDFHELRIRIVHPKDPELTFLVDEASLEEVD
jgi:hypothetical protein